jgi:hypothetical protein
MEVNKFELDGSDNGNKLYQAISAITLAAMAGQQGGQVEALSVGVSAVAGAIQGLAAIVGQREGIDADSPEMEQRSTVNMVSVLVAALLVAKATRTEHEESVDCLNIQLNPIIYLAAINAARDILGRDIDTQLNPRMVEAARRWEKEQGVFGGWEQQTHEIQVGAGGHLH